MRYTVTEENEKKRLYVEVQYARVSSSTFKETASIFCLKQNGRNLTTQEYANNLIKYMDDTESMNTLALADLNTVLVQMVDNDGNCETEEPCEGEVIIKTVASNNSVYDDSPDNVTQMIVNDFNCETKETYKDEVIINYVIHFAFSFIYLE